MPAKILNQAQAEAVYAAMCHLNNVSGTIKATFPITPEKSVSGTFIRVREDDGRVKVLRSVDYLHVAHEFFDDQSAFATAYGLPQG